jgi:hypothetical protein
MQGNDDEVLWMLRLRQLLRGNQLRHAGKEMLALTLLLPVLQLHDMT